MRRLAGITAAVLSASCCAVASAATAQTAAWTAADKTAALHAAHHEANRFAKHTDSTGWPTTVHSVTAVIRSGPIPGGSNTGHACGHGKHAVITLIGNFPMIATGGTPGAAGTAVHGVVATTKLGRAQVCLLSVRTGKVKPMPKSIVLFSR
jgi:hypothetical protein